MSVQQWTKGQKNIDTRVKSRVLLTCNWEGNYNNNRKYQDSWVWWLLWVLVVAKASGNVGKVRKKLE